MIDYYCGNYRNSSGLILPGSGDISDGLPHRRNRRTAVPATELAPSRYLLYSFRVSSLDHRHFRTICRQSLFAAFLAFPDYLPGVSLL